MTLIERDTAVGSLNHIGIAVVSIERSLKQFQDLFGSPDAEILRSDERGLRACFIEQGETHIELLEPLRADTVIGRFIDEHGEGIHHLAFTVADLDAKAAELTGLAIPIIDGPREGFRTRIAFADSAATHGVLIELVARTSPVP
ncbi:MAG: VOC family protein [Chloroflexi bacterium]|nr:VOC family protein [Chloroflexota bacterium]